MLIEDFKYSPAVKESFMNAGNYLSSDKTSLGIQVSKELNYETLDKEWINISDWTRIAQNQLLEPIPNPISINREDGMFLMGGFLHSVLEDTTVPEFPYEENDNLLAELLSCCILSLNQNDFSSSYMYLQTWLVFMSRFITDYKVLSSTQTTAKVIKPYNL